MFRAVAALAAVVLATPVLAADAVAPTRDFAEAAPPAPGAYHRAARPGDRGTFALRDGRFVAGELVTSSDFTDVVRQADGKNVFLPGHAVAEVYPDGPAPRGWGVPEGSVRAYLRDGRVVEGRLVSRDDDALRLDAPGGEAVALGPAELDEAYDARGRLPRLRAFADAARPRAIATPTAFLLDRGEVAIGTHLLDAGASVGLFDWAMLSASSTVPVGYASEWTANVTLEARAGLPLGRWLRVAGGCQAYVAGDATVVSVLAAATVGSRDLNLTLHAGPPPTGAERLGAFGDTIASASGYWRVHRRVALVAEGWTGVDGGSDRLGAVGARLIGRRWAIDFGGAATSAGEVVPYVAVDLTVLVP